MGIRRAVLDACVLLPPSVCDLFLRLAESPSLYEPQWTESILNEVARNQVAKFGFDPGLSRYWRSEVTRVFPEALVADYEPYLPQCQNQEKDRHVLAASIQCQAETIVTFNLRDFPDWALAPWSIKAVHPSDFALSLFEIQPSAVLAKLNEMARERRYSQAEMLGILAKSLPAFADRIAGELGIEPILPPRA